MKHTAIVPTIFAAMLVTLTSSANARILKVGPGQQYSVPSQAAAAAQDGDTVEITAGTYTGDVAVWHANHLTIRGVGGQPSITAEGHAAEQKGIWVIHGNDVTVENVELSGAVVADKNGAGIRAEGNGLTVRGCYIHNNQDGILTDASPGNVTVEDCVFTHNGAGDGYSHNIYVGHVHRFTLRGCAMSDAVVGHDVKSRAQINNILYNAIEDDPTSNTSNLIDLPNGGDCRIVGNILRRDSGSDNRYLIRFGEEGATNPVQSLNIVNNTIISSVSNVTTALVAGHPTIRVVNNLCAGCTLQLSGNTGQVDHNLTVPFSDFSNAGNGNYHLAPGSAALGAGTDAGTDNGFDLTPRFEFQAPSGVTPRMAHHPIDLGAYAGG